MSFLFQDHDAIYMEYKFFKFILVNLKINKKITLYS